MKRFGLLILCCLALALPARAVVATDNFNTADDGLSANWTLISGHVFRVYSFSVTPGEAAQVEFAFWNADTFTANQYSQLVVAAVGAGGTAVGPAVRIAAATKTGYIVHWDDTVITLYRAVADVYTPLGTSTAPSVSDLIYVEANGTQITVKKNGGTIIGPVTDAIIATGQPGISGYDNGNLNRGDDWEGGDLGGGAAAAKRRIINSD